jgi:hypothetical protein
VLRLAAGFPEWTRRRKTSFRFIDETTVEHRLSIDLFLPAPDWFGEAAPTEGETIYVPLYIFQKEALAALSVAKADGEAVSVLNTEENGTLATEGFNALINGYAESDAAIPADAFRGHLDRIVTAPTSAAGETAFKVAMSAGLEDWLPSGDQYRALLEDLRGGFLMLVPVEYKTGASFIFKVDWSAPFTWSHGSVGGRLRTAAASLGLADKDLRFTDLPIGWAKGTHFEYSQPDNVHNLETVLSVDQHDPDGSRRRIPRRKVVVAKPQADVNVSIRDRDNPVACRSDVGAVALALRPRLGGVFMPIVVAAWLTVGLLWAIGGRLEHLDAQTSAAVVLVLPAVVAIYLAREGEHAIAARLLVGVRLCGLAVALIAVVAATLIGVGDLRNAETSPVREAECLTPRANGPNGRGKLRLGSRTTCRISTASAGVVEPNGSLQRVLRYLALLATVVAVLLSLGAWSTHRAVANARSREDEADRGSG